MTDATDPGLARARCERALPRLESDAPGAAGDRVLHALPGLGLCATYVAPDGHGGWHELRAHDIELAGLSPETLHARAVANLESRARRDAEVLPYGHLHAVQLGDELEAALLLADGFWDAQSALAPGGLVAVAPGRDVLAFGDAASPEALHELDDLCTRVASAVDHPLTDAILARTDRGWTAAG